MALLAKLKHYWQNHTLPVAILTLLSGFLLLADLGDGYLWQDEAQSALISRSVLMYGVPKATDGQNTFTQEMDAVLGDHKTWRYHPWLHFYATAASFAAFGESTFSARLPFALSGIGAVILLYFLGLKVTKDQRTAFIAAFLLSISVAFLLLSTQCRYYGLAIFFAVWGAHSFFRMIQFERFGFTLFVGTTFLLFHAHYIYCATLFFSLLVYTWFFARENLKRVVGAMAIVTVVNIPAIIWYGSAGQNAAGNLLTLPKSFSFIKTFGEHIHQFLVPGGFFLILGVLAFVGLAKTANKKGVGFSVSLKALALPVIFTFLTVLFIAILVHKPYFRYIGPIIPFCFLGIAILIRWTMQIHSLTGVALILIWIATGDLKSYCQEITTDYYGPMEGITEFLNRYAKPKDTVAIPYGDLPVKFYTDLHVIGGLSTQDYSKAANADWVILRKNSIMEADAEFKKYLLNNLNLDNYKQTRINYPDIPYQNREVPNMHHYKPVRNAPKVRILKRMDTTAKSNTAKQ